MTLKPKLDIRLDVIELVAVIITLITFFVSWNRTDSARAQKLLDLTNKVNTLEQQMNNTNDKIDKILFEVGESSRQ